MQKKTGFVDTAYKFANIVLKSYNMLWLSTTHFNSWKTVKKICYFAPLMTTIIERRRCCYAIVLWICIRLRSLNIPLAFSAALLSIHDTHILHTHENKTTNEQCFLTVLYPKGTMILQHETKTTIISLQVKNGP